MSPRPSNTRMFRLQDERLLYVVLLLVLESVYGWALFVVPALRIPSQFSLFTLLMLAHVRLHLAAPRLEIGGWRLALRFLGSVLLALVMGSVSHTAPAPY